MFTATRDTTEQTLPEQAYARERNTQLRRQLRPTLITACALTAFHVATDLWNRPELSLTILRNYVALVAVPLICAAASYLPARMVAAQTIATIFDVAFSVILASFLFAPAGNLSAVAVAISLKMLATSVLIPWRPRQQDLSEVMTLAIYFGALWIIAPPILYTHQLIAPVLAAVLATIGCRRLDRTHRALFEHSAELERSSQRLGHALHQERVLMGVANEINVLSGLSDVLDTLNRATAEATRSSFATTLLVHGDDDSVELASSYSDEGLETHEIGARFPNWTGSTLQKAMSRGETVVVEDVSKQNLVPPEAMLEAGVQIIAFSPIVRHGSLLGVLLAGRTTGGQSFNDREVAILSGIAATAAITINNARLYEKLTASESAYRDLFERANDLILVADADGSIHFANEAALRFLDRAPADLASADWRDLLDDQEAGRMRRRIRIAVNRAAAHAEPFNVEASSPRYGDSILEIRARLISPPGQRPERFQCIARDVTERTRRDEETRALLARLQESQRLQDEFVANMSHELRTPLNVIIGYADLIADDLHLPINSDARSFLDRIGAASRALHRMVESILEYARLDRGRMTVIPTNFSSDHLLLELEALCNDVRSSFEVKLDLKQERSIDFLTDYDRLYSVLSNLLLNALKFTPKGQIVLTLRQDRDTAVFRVSDTGIGIEPEELRSVFEPFRQVDGSDTRAFGGVGLGLAIVRRNVDLLRGTIDVDSAPEEGTTFEVRIPIELEGAGALRRPSAA